MSTTKNGHWTLSIIIFGPECTCIGVWHHMPAFQFWNYRFQQVGYAAKLLMLKDTLALRYSGLDSGKIKNRAHVIKRFRRNILIEVVVVVVVFGRKFVPPRVRISGMVMIITTTHAATMIPALTNSFVFGISRLKRKSDIVEQGKSRVVWSTLENFQCSYSR